MRKMFLDDLPRWGKGGKAKEGSINWEESIGHKIKFIYDDIEGEIPILNTVYKKNRKYIVTEYGGYKNFHLITNHLLNCKLGELIGARTGRYKFSIGEIVEDVHYGKLKILECIKVPTGINKIMQKAYKYQCLICGNIDTIKEGMLINNHGCNVCSIHPTKVLKGYNDLWTTHSNIAKMLKFPEVGHTISFGNQKKQTFICPDCGIEKDICVASVVKYGFPCSRCGDGISYPEKIMYNVLEQLEIQFDVQLSKTTFDWCGKYRYDFYIPSINGICETHGIQHYEESNRGRSLYETQENDRVKKELALQNGFEEENYIVIDCRKSELEFIKDKIIHSRLSELFDLSNIDWLKCHEYACSSLVRIVCGLWMDSVKNIEKIKNKLKLDRTTVRKYLKQGKKLNWCDYDAKEGIKNNGKNVGKYNEISIICINTGCIYKSASFASRNLNISQSDICSCCKGNKKSAGKHPITNEPLHWMYHEDYLLLKENK